MPAPETIDQFLDLARQMPEMDCAALEELLPQLALRRPLPQTPRDMAQALADAGLLSYFQAEQLLLGRWHGYTIGQYRVIERLGSGGTANVFLCEHTAMRRLVAAKVPYNELAEDPEVRERFFRESQVSAVLKHPNVIRVHDVHLEGKQLCLIMEYLDGSTLRSIVTTHGPMDVVRAAHYVRQAAQALEHIHAAGIVHRDVKPGNLLLGRKGVVKLFDFGVARFLRDDAPVLTSQEIVLGSADYIAPEQALDSHGAATAADIYSLGVTLYFLLAGRAPFEGVAPAEKLLQLQTQAPPPLRSLRPQVPAELAAVVERLMAKDAARRYPSAAEAAEALLPWAKDPIPPPPAEEMPRLAKLVHRKVT